MLVSSKCPLLAVNVGVPIGGGQNARCDERAQCARIAHEVQELRAFDERAQKNDEDARPHHAARENQKRAFARKKASVQAHEPPHDLAAERLEEAGSVETFHAGFLRV